MYHLLTYKSHESVRVYLPVFLLPPIGEVGYYVHMAAPAPDVVPFKEGLTQEIVIQEEQLWVLRNATQDTSLYWIDDVLPGILFGPISPSAVVALPTIIGQFIVYVGEGDSTAAVLTIGSTEEEARYVVGCFQSNLWHCFAQTCNQEAKIEFVVTDYRGG